MGEVKVVLPGEELGAAEEFVPGEGTYREGGRIYSARFGFLVKKDMTIKVFPINPWPELKPGVIVYAIVQEYTDDIAVVKVVAREGSLRSPIAPNTHGIIHVSEVSRRYVRSIPDAFRVGDILRARVLTATPTLRLSTKHDKLGVVVAYCGTCRTRLIRKGNSLDSLYCPRCRRFEKRKVSSLYGRLRPDIAGLLLHGSTSAERILKASGLQP
ncbi:MAG: RNA-binding protein [Thermoplasmata archaeon]|nr:MAG: RNA-binding protein [Thermoplasmata archaeon]HDJ27241.1 RNA-binding protein [Aciduliprofundum sp.]